VPKSKAEKLTELRTLDEVIAERKKYHREQETLINETCEQGNSELMALTHEITLSKQVLRDLKTDIRTAAQDKVLLNEDLEDIRKQIGKAVKRVPGLVNAFA
jgi:chromosome segregation ATPase